MAAPVFIVTAPLTIFSSLRNIWKLGVEKLWRKINSPLDKWFQGQNAKTSFDAKRKLYTNEPVEESKKPSGTGTDAITQFVSEVEPANQFTKDNVCEFILNNKNAFELLHVIKRCGYQNISPELYLEAQQIIDMLGAESYVWMVCSAIFSSDNAKNKVIQTLPETTITHMSQQLNSTPDLANKIKNFQGKYGKYREKVIINAKTVLTAVEGITQQYPQYPRPFVCDKRVTQGEQKRPKQNESENSGPIIEVIGANHK